MDVLAALEALRHAQSTADAAGVGDEFHGLSFDTVTDFIDLCRLTRSSIESVARRALDTPPENLSIQCISFLAAYLSLDRDTIKVLWSALKSLVWSCDYKAEHNKQRMAGARQKHLKRILTHGLFAGITPFEFAPPTKVCLDCRKKVSGRKHNDQPEQLSEEMAHPATVFTKDYGALPCWTTSLYCRGCKSRYHHNFYANNENDTGTRTYYKQDFDFLQVEKHYFIETAFIEQYTYMMVSAWASASNIARIYNETYAAACSAAMDVHWLYALKLDTEKVWDGFFLHALLLDHRRRDSVLQLAHKVPQRERLRTSLRARTARYAGPGSPFWNHACDACSPVWEDKEGNLHMMRSVVTDGVDVQHPCCQVHDCAVPLDSMRDHFCPEHRHRHNICAVEDCEQQAEHGHQTCNSKAHCELESTYHAQNTSMFQLKHRLERAKTYALRDAIGGADSAAAQPSEGPLDDQEKASEDDDDAEVDSEEAARFCEGKSEQGNKKLRARFGRRRTHNEELAVYSCGVIMGRATFFGSEAPNGVREFWEALFPTKTSLPAVNWHDNNCQILRMLHNDPDHRRRTYFDECALPVHVFHFRTKHKESDLICQQCCNPAIWPDLMTPEGTWRFNSSAAEQANAWIVGFKPITRVMQADRCNFFLDEVIRRRNKMLVKELKAKGKAPWFMPREQLLELS